MQVKESIISNGKAALNPSYLVVHETANPGATALNHVSYWKNDPTYSVHYVMDWTGIAYHCVPDTRMCWHVGGGNGFTVGIELCHATNAADFAKVWSNAVEFCAWYLRKQGWGVERLLSHYDCTRKWGGSDHTDPIGYFGQFGKTWAQFKEEVRKKMAAANAPKQNPGTAKNGAGIKYHAHCQTVGDLATVRDGQVAGTIGYGKRLEALVIDALPEGWELEAVAHVQGVGWRTYRGIKNGVKVLIGTKGEGRRIEALGFRVVKRPVGDERKLHFQVHQQHYSWKADTLEGYTSGSDGEAMRVEAVKIWIA